MDCFYKILNRKQHEQAERNEYNFDHPDAFDFELMLDVLKKLKEGRKVEVPVYNFVTHARETNTKTMYGANVIIFEGILTFHSAEVLKILDMKIFVDTDSDIRLARRLKRLVHVATNGILVINISSFQRHFATRPRSRRRLETIFHDGEAFVF